MLSYVMVKIRESAPRFQYLGKRGVTDPCIEAMVTVITSHRPPDYISVVSADRDHTSVCFVAWGWLGTELTIIPDGFGTHGGAGLWGLSYCLALIQSSEIRLEEVELNEQEFERICNAPPTYKDIESLMLTHYGSSEWPSFLIDRDANALEEGRIWWYSPWGRQEQLPEWLLMNTLQTGTIAKENH